MGKFVQSPSNCWAAMLEYSDFSFSTETLGGNSTGRFLFSPGGWKFIYPNQTSELRTQNRIYTHSCYCSQWCKNQQWRQILRQTLKAGGECQWEGIENTVGAWEHILEGKCLERVLSRVNAIWDYGCQREVKLNDQDLHPCAVCFVLFPSMVWACTSLEFATLWGFLSSPLPILLLSY